MSELERWEARFAAPGYHFGTEPNAFLKSKAGLLKPGQKALSIAEAKFHGGTATKRPKPAKLNTGIEIQVPVGTLIRDVESGERLGELLEDGERLVVARGGRYGLGNENFKTPANRTPRQFTYGTDGEVRRLEFTMKLIADVGLVGEPNAGKSTLISVVSAAHPKIA
jgi:GTP-binding protein